MHTIGFRDVAAEAGVSVNLVQYYFPTKARLLHGGLIHVRARISERLRQRLNALPRRADAARRIRTILHELLPIDEASTDLYRVHAAYAALALTDPDLAALPHTAGPDDLHPELTKLLTTAQRTTRAHRHHPARPSHRPVGLHRLRLPQPRRSHPRPRCIRSGRW
ncbi:hypothetical protein [Allokutzneria oryzae]|uniref:TetR family transcriptional regulator n=1 Tax=Allokutzneria oryzae TaxID=1378989 RepID=A0ABV5ZTL2_9PSEU